MIFSDLPEAVMDEINKAALERTDEFVKLGHKAIQDSIEFARERSYIHECVKGDNDSVATGSGSRIYRVVGPEQGHVLRQG